MMPFFFVKIPPLGISSQIDPCAPLKVFFSDEVNNQIKSDDNSSHVKSQLF